MQHYHLQKYIIKKDSSMIHLNLNEFEYPHHPGFIQNIKDKITETIITKYYDEKLTVALNAKLAKFNNIPIESILLTNGADSIIETLVSVYLKRGDSANILVPTYGGYERFCTLNDVKIVKTVSPLEDSGCIPVRKIEEDIIFICTPNNPTGKIYTPCSFEPLIQDNPNVLFVFDETYADFYILENHTADVFAQFIKYKNVFVVKSLSKAFGLAGVRLGYLISHPDNVVYLDKLYNHKSVQDISKVCAIDVFDNLPYYQWVVKRIKICKALIIKFLQEHRIKYIDSPANFICVNVGGNENKESNLAGFLECARAANLIFRDISKRENMAGYIRMTIGDEKTTSTVLDFLKNYYKPRLVVCLDGTYYTGSVIYTLKFLDFLNFLSSMYQLVVCSILIDPIHVLTKKYKIIPYTVGIFRKTDIVLVNCVYCIRVLSDISTLGFRPRKIILGYHNGYRSTKEILPELIKRETIKSSLENFRKLLNVSDEFLIVNEDQRAFFNFSDHKINIISSPLARQILDSPNPSNPIDMTTRKTKIKFLTVGTICARKNQLKLMEIFSKLNIDAELYVVGLEKKHPHGYYLEYGKKCVKFAELHPNIKIIDACDSSTYYKMCDVFVFFSTLEESPLVITEALSYGLPVITSNCGNVSDAITNGYNGFIFNTYSEASDLMVRITEDEYMRKKLASHCRKSVESWYVDGVSKIDKWRSMLFTPVVIVVDLDNTIINYEKQFLKRWNNMHPTNKHMSMDYFIGKKIENVDEFHANFYDHVDVYPESIECLRKLHQLPEFQVYLCSHCESKNITKSKKEWIKKNLGPDWVDRFISIETNECDKTHINCDIMIDDNPDVANGKREHPWKYVIYYDQSYNKHMQHLSAVPNFTWGKISQLTSLGRDIIYNRR